MKKTEYLNKQQTQIEQYISHSKLVDSFKALKARRDHCKAKKRRYEFAYQMYIYHLGKRVMQMLQAYAVQQKQKKQWK